MDDKYKYLEELTKFFQIEYTHDELVRLLKKIEKLNNSSGESQENDDIKDAITDRLPYMETIGGYNYLFACGCAINAYMREDNVIVDCNMTNTICNLCFLDSNKSTSASRSK